MKKGKDHHGEKRYISLIVRLLATSLIVVVCTTTGAVIKSAQAAVTSSELVTLLQDVKGADGHHYSVVDDQNVGMDTLKIIANPQGGYLAVYHHAINSVFQVSWPHPRIYSAGIM